MDVQLKRRFDVIPNLVNTVKGYAQHEEGLFTKVTEARTNFEKAASPADKLSANNAVSMLLPQIYAVAENYPDLKANANFLELQRELVDTEDKIQSARRFFNGAVESYNTKLVTFPSNIAAQMLGYTEEKYFETSKPEERDNVKVEF
ncbi:MAG: LemA family protein [Candidatus Parcubacteria bacterium]|nr:LemA family protein [Candidatus Parcubacteria bacterium]